jgi:hypothetical protein
VSCTASAALRRVAEDDTLPSEPDHGGIVPWKKIADVAIFLVGLLILFFGNAHFF